MALDYSSHLNLPLLLNLQKPLSASQKNDELFFIVIHQVHELLFKILLHEIDHIKESFCNNKIYIAIEKWKRCELILETSLSQFDTLETMSPGAFDQFRKTLKNASGFQSYQFREIEFVLGYKRPDFLELYHSNPSGYNALKTRLSSKSVIDCLYILLDKNGAIVPKKLLARDVTLSQLPNKNIQKIILAFYEKHAAFRMLFESMLDFDITFSKWRFRHWKTVERMIGRKKGTRGTTVPQRFYDFSQQVFFTDLWAIRNKL